MAKTVTPDTLYTTIRQGDRVDLLDLRSHEEFEAWHITGPSVNIARVSGSNAIAATVNGTITDLIDQTTLEPPIIVVCPRGEQSAEIAEALTEAGIQAANLVEGMRGWARLFIDRPVEAATGVIQFERPSSGCLSYLLYDDDAAAVIDPLRAFTDDYIETVDEYGVSIDWAVDTHIHADHFSGIRALAARTDATPVLPQAATDRGLEFDARLLNDGAELSIGTRSLTTMHAPGHTHELSVYRWDDVLLTGDALFLGSVGRPDLEPGATEATELADKLYDTLNTRLLQRPRDTIIAPGHASEDPHRAPDDTITATLNTVRKRIHLKYLDRNTFVDHLTTGLPPRPANYEQIVATNLGQHSVDDDTAFELELGPNNCAVTTTSPQ